MTKIFSSEEFIRDEQDRHARVCDSPGNVSLRRLARRLLDMAGEIDKWTTDHHDCDCPLCEHMFQELWDECFIVQYLAKELANSIRNATYKPSGEPVNYLENEPAAAVADEPAIAGTA